MSVEQNKVVDFISFDKNDVVVLTISDHLDWQNEKEHIFTLQEKINDYLAFMESNEIIEKFPAAKGKKYAISVAALHEPTKRGFEFLKHVQSVIEKAGFIFRFELCEVKD